MLAEIHVFSEQRDGVMSLQEELSKVIPIHAEMLVFVDIETTGLSIKHGAKTRELAILGTKDTELYWSDNTHIEWPQKSILFFLRGFVLVGHNIMFDIRFLLNECYFIEPLSIRFVDTLVLAEKMGWPKRLSSIVQRFQLELTSHHAIDDAKASRFIYNSYTEKYGSPEVYRLMREGKN